MTTCYAEKVSQYNISSICESWFHCHDNDNLLSKEGSKSILSCWSSITRIRVANSGLTDIGRGGVLV